MWPKCGLGVPCYFHFQSKCLFGDKCGCCHESSLSALICCWKPMLETDGVENHMGLLWIVPLYSDLYSIMFNPDSMVTQWWLNHVQSLSSIMWIMWIMSVRWQVSDVVQRSLSGRCPETIETMRRFGASADRPRSSSEVWTATIFRWYLSDICLISVWYLYDIWYMIFADDSGTKTLTLEVNYQYSLNTEYVYLQQLFQWFGWSYPIFLTVGHSLKDICVADVGKASIWFQVMAKVCKGGVYPLLRSTSPLICFLQCPRWWSQKCELKSAVIYTVHITSHTHIFILYTYLHLCI